MRKIQITTMVLVLMIIFCNMSMAADPSKSSKDKIKTKSILLPGQIKNLKAQKISPKNTPKGFTADAVMNPAELRIVRINRIGTGPVHPGEVVSINVVIANSGRTSATVSAASVGPSSSVNRSLTSAVIPPRGQAFIRLDIPIELQQIRANQFRTTVAIVKPNVEGRRGWLDQIWKDNNKNDNAMGVRYSVTVSVYAVTATVTRIHVLNDCDRDGPGEWPGGIFSLQASNNTVLTPGPSITRPVDGGERDSVFVFDHFSGVDSGAGDTASLNTGQTVRPPHAEVQLRSVGARQYIFAFMSTGWEVDEFGKNDYLCGRGGVRLWLTPEQWQRGGDFYSADSLFRVFFTISARPVSTR